MNKFLSIVIVFSAVISNVYSQIATSSPYSRFGLGELQESILPQYNGFGGASTAITNSNSVNPNNPATYTSFGPNSFLLSTGGWHQTTRMQNINADQIVNNNAFSHLILGFPINRKLGASIGMIPFSNIGYEINARDNDYNADMNYYGDGGISNIYFGGAYALSNSFSIGLNASYLFGGLNRRKQLVYDDDSFLTSKSNSKINLKGYYYELGLLYEKMINENDAFSIGFLANNNSLIRAKRSEIVFSELDGEQQDIFVDDTEWGYINLPRNTSCGISYNKDKKWLLVADYNLQDWADYRMFDESDNLANSSRISAGIQYTPDYNSVTKYYKRVDYRFGGSYSNTPLQFDNRQLIEKSISFGFGIPVKKSRTKYDFSCTLGQRGTLEGKLIKEQFIRLGLSVSYDGIWFVKRKYD